MPGYYLLETRHLSPPLPQGRGFPANPVRLGFLDFLRELQQEEFSLITSQGLLIEGLEDVLLAARPNVDAMAMNIRRILQRSASDLNDRLAANVQIVFRHSLVRGEKLWVEHPTENFFISQIFGSPPKKEVNGVPYYRVSFNLSSGF